MSNSTLPTPPSEDQAGAAEAALKETVEKAQARMPEILWVLQRLAAADWRPFKVSMSLVEDAEPFVSYLVMYARLPGNQTIQLQVDFDEATPGCHELTVMDWIYEKEVYMCEVFPGQGFPTPDEARRYLTSVLEELSNNQDTVGSRPLLFQSRFRL